MDKITQDRVRELFEYRDGELYRRISPCNSVPVGARAGTANSRDGYHRARVDGRTYLVHRLIYLMHHGSLPDFLDHINGARDDNRIENLRPCTAQQNGYNAKTPRNNTSGVKGVSWYKRYHKWHAQIRANGLMERLGYFDTIEEAKAVIDTARAEHHGAFARY